MDSNFHEEQKDYAKSVIGRIKEYLSGLTHQESKVFLKSQAEHWAKRASYPDNLMRKGDSIISQVVNKLLQDRENSIFVKGKHQDMG